MMPIFNNIHVGGSDLGRTIPILDIPPLGSGSLELMCRFDKVAYEPPHG